MTRVIANGAPKFQHTAARRRLAWYAGGKRTRNFVSTHSRPKAAGRHKRLDDMAVARFNTQPPEGGWSVCFQLDIPITVSTHSRPKAAGSHGHGHGKR